MENVQQHRKLDGGTSGFYGREQNSGLTPSPSSWAFKRHFTKRRRCLRIWLNGETKLLQFKWLEDAATPLIAFLQNAAAVQELKADKHYNLQMLDDKYQTGPAQIEALYQSDMFIQMVSSLKFQVLTLPPNASLEDCALILRATRIIARMEFSISSETVSSITC